MDQLIQSIDILLMYLGSLYEDHRKHFLITPKPLLFIEKG